MMQLDWIHLVIDHVERNIRNPISINDLSELAGYSARHFQRLFRERTSESVMEYVRGRRLSHAIQDITHTDKSLIEIAFDFQFESQQSFTRAFQARFSHPPRRFRNQKVKNPPSLRRKLDAAYLEMMDSKSITLEPKIHDFEDRLYVGLQKKMDIDSYGDKTMLSSLYLLAQSFLERQSEIDQSAIIPSREGGVFISHRVPKAKRADHDGVVVTAAVRIDSPIEMPVGMVLIKTPAAKYALFELRGSLSKLQQAGYYITGTWFPRSTYRVGNGPTFHYFPLKPGQSYRTLLPLRNRTLKLTDEWWD